MLYEFDIIIFTGTLSFEDIYNCEIKLPNFNIYRCERKNKNSIFSRGGGVSIAVGKIYDATENVEHLFIRIVNFNVVIGTVITY